MAGVVFIFVRDDASDVEALAEAFEHAGYSISGSDASEGALSVVVWSRAALRSPAFRSAVDRAALSSKVIVASLIAPPIQDEMRDARIVDISSWDGVDCAALDPLFDAVLEVSRPVYANVIALPGPVYQDAEFTEPRRQIPTDASADARAAWETPIPTILLRPVHDDVREEPRPEKLGAPSPRRDFRRLRSETHTRAHAALVFALIAVIGGVSFALHAPASTRAAPQVAQTQAGGVSLTTASTEAIGLDDSAPTERARLFEPAQQVGHPGVEPPSARTVRSAAYTSHQTHADDSRALIPAAIDAAGQRSKTRPIS